jgi:hypothetical protein
MAAGSPHCPDKQRRVVHFRVTEHPTEEWTVEQMREAFPWDQAPRSKCHLRKGLRPPVPISGNGGSAYCAAIPLAKSVCRTLGELHPTPRRYLALGKDAPDPRAVEPPERGRVVAIPQVGGLHHRTSDAPLNRCKPVPQLQGPC